MQLLENLLGFPFLKTNTFLKVSNDVKIPNNFQLPYCVYSLIQQANPG